MITIHFTSINIFTALGILLAGYGIIIARRRIDLEKRAWKYEPSGIPFALAAAIVLISSLFQLPEVFYAIYCLISLVVLCVFKNALDIKNKIIEDGNGLIGNPYRF